MVSCCTCACVSATLYCRKLMNDAVTGPLWSSPSPASVGAPYVEVLCDNDDLVHHRPVHIRREGASGRVRHSQVEPLRRRQRVPDALTTSIRIQLTHHDAVRRVVAQVDAVHRTARVPIAAEDPAVLLTPPTSVHVHAQRHLTGLPRVTSGPAQRGCCPSRMTESTPPTPACPPTGTTRSEWHPHAARTRWRR